MFQEQERQFELVYLCFQLHEAIINNDLSATQTLVEKINTQFTTEEKSDVSLINSLGITQIIHNLQTTSPKEINLDCIKYTLSNLINPAEDTLMKKCQWDILIFPYMRTKHEDAVKTFLQDYIQHPEQLQYNYQYMDLIRLSYRYFDPTISQQLKILLDQHYQEQTND